ncbi:hypothetical protein EVAR_81772_1 [Eumeta japonica]|uniref:Uncharacterized protein n=1 Tax=Eumeta variegata TaxID=151549 RepID=A0A4C1UHU2_EUMVA|nr:hypothetical protein EVAR_81772_1 [Eumeta japonica]
MKSELSESSSGALLLRYSPSPAHKPSLSSIRCPILTQEVDNTLVTSLRKIGNPTGLNYAFNKVIALRRLTAARTHRRMQRVCRFRDAVKAHRGITMFSLRYRRRAGGIGLAVEILTLSLLRQIIDFKMRGA